MKENELGWGWYDPEEERKRLNDSALAYSKEQVIEEGEKKKEREMVLAMYGNNEPLDKIQKYSGLSQEEVERISYEQDVCIELTSSQREFYQVGNCFLNTSSIKSKFLYEELEEKTYIFQNSRFKNKVLVYGKKLGMDTYLFI